MSKRRLFATVIFALYCTTNIQSVSYITKCKSNNSNCAKASTQAAIPIFAAGLPEYGVKPLDPVTFQRIDASSSNLKLILTNVTAKGLKNCIAKEVKRDKSKSKLFFKFQCTGKLDGQYEMKGRLLILPIEGKGPIHVDLRKAEISIEVDMEDDKDYWNVKKWKHSFELKDKSDVVFKNLFNGNKVLGEAAREVLAVSGNDIILEVGPPVIKILVDTVVAEVKRFFHNVPAKDLSID